MEGTKILNSHDHVLNYQRYIEFLVSVQWRFQHSKSGGYFQFWANINVGEQKLQDSFTV